MQQVMNEREAADFVGVARATLSRWRAEGNGPPYAKLATGTIRYRMPDIDKWLDESTVKAGPSNSSGSRTTIRRVRS